MPEDERFEDYVELENYIEAIAGNPGELARANAVLKAYEDAVRLSQQKWHSSRYFLQFMADGDRQWLIDHILIGYMHHDQAFVDSLTTGTPAVKYLNTAQERAQYHIGGSGGKLMYDQVKPPKPLDTTKMNSLMSGTGYGIYAMSPDGQIYAGEHKGAQFHHSSFLAGGDVAGAGEFRTTNDGTLKEITTKSGHYKPTVAQLAQTLRELQGQMSLDGVVLKLNTSLGLVPYPYDAQHFLKTYKPGMTADTMMALVNSL